MATTATRVSAGVADVEVVGVRKAYRAVAAVAGIDFAVSTALISGALLAFALSFDEVIVTTFTAGAQNTLPLWIFGNIRLGQTLPETNVVVLLVLAATILPVVLAQRLTRESGILRTE